VKIRGATAEQRREARARRSSQRRVQHYLRLMRDTHGQPWTQLQHACDYLKAVASDLVADRVTELVKDVTQLADRWNQR
jgi:hypothetical protein